MGDVGARTGATGHPTVGVVIPWRDGGDEQRRADYRHTVSYYLDLDLGPVVTPSDGRTSGHFNRHAAYNRGYASVAHDCDAVLWNEADTLIPQDQIIAGARLALAEPGLVVPYTERHELDSAQTWAVFEEDVDPFTLRGAANVFTQGASIGQAGITSHATMDAIGGRWDEAFEGWGYDDNAAFLLFAALAGPPRWVDGKGIHLWHTPAYTVHTPESEAATQANAARHQMLSNMTRAELVAYVHAAAK